MYLTHTISVANDQSNQNYNCCNSCTSEVKSNHAMHDSHIEIFHISQLYLLCQECTEIKRLSTNHTGFHDEQNYK